MTNTIAKITEKIVEVTGNQSTEAFVGKKIERTNCDGGVMYIIEDTNYVFTPAEYKMFAEAGAIAASKVNAKPQRATKTVKKSAPKKQTAKASQTSKKSVASKRKESRETEAYTFGGEELHAAIECSSFLQNYPDPSFSLDTPRRFKLFDKKDAVKEKATGFFDRIGKNSRDKIVSAMSSDE